MPGHDHRTRIALALLCALGAAPARARAYALLDAGVETPSTAPDAGSSVAVPPAAADPEGDAQGADAVVRATGTLAGQSRGSTHLVLVTGEDLRRTPATTLDEALARLPVVSLQGMNKNRNNDGSGLALIDLRNLGASRTLVLLNGRRLVPSNYGRGEAVDLNTIPLALIERVEVLLDGASAIYGSDAVGGVINVILRDDFEGVHAELIGGLSGRADGEELGGSLTFGTQHGRGRATLHVHGLVRRPVWQRDRRWARNPVVDRSWIDEDDPAAGVQTLYGSGFRPDGGDAGGDWVFRVDPATGAGITPAADAPRYDFARESYLVGAQARVGVMGLADYRLGHGVHAFAEASHLLRHSRTRLPPAVLLATDTFPYGVRVPLTNRFLPPALAAALPAGSTDFALIRRMAELGPRSSDYESNTSRFVVGARGEAPAARLDWEVYLNLGIDRTHWQTRNSVNLARVRETLDPAACAALASLGCVEGNYFGAGALSPEAADYVRLTDTQWLGNTHLSTGLTLRSQPFGWLGRRVALAAGLSFRRESGFNRPSSALFLGESYVGRQQQTSGTFRITEAVVEANLPLLSRLPGARDLSLRGAGRLTHHDGFGARGTYLASLTYAPLRALRLRASHTTSYRAPGITELHAGASRSAETVVDPCSGWSGEGTDPVVRANCQRQGIPTDYAQSATTGPQVGAAVGGNPELEPERGRQLNLGVRLTLPARRWTIGTLVATADYYHLTLDDAIVSSSGDGVLGRCYGSVDLSSPACGLITRRPDGALTSIDARARNAQRIVTSGVDASIRYALPLTRAGLRGPGRLDLGWLSNRLIHYDETTDGIKRRYAGKLDAYGGIQPAWRWNLTARLSWAAWSLGSTHRYLGGARVTNGVSASDTSVPHVLYWDLVAAFEASRYALLLGLNNVLDRAPPLVADGTTNSSANSYDYVGRYLYARLRAEL